MIHPALQPDDVTIAILAKLTGVRCVRGVDDWTVYPDTARYPLAQASTPMAKMATTPELLAWLHGAFIAAAMAALGGQP